jgi:hypothetical protein
MFTLVKASTCKGIDSNIVFEYRKIMRSYLGGGLVSQVDAGMLVYSHQLIRGTSVIWTPPVSVKFILQQRNRLAAALVQVFDFQGAFSQHEVDSLNIQ